MITVQICIIVLHEVDICYLAKMKKSQFEAGRSRCQAGWSWFPTGRKIIKMALSVVLKAAVAWDLEPRSKLWLDSPFSKNRNFNTAYRRMVKKWPFLYMYNTYIHVHTDFVCYLFYWKCSGLRWPPGCRPAIAPATRLSCTIQNHKLRHTINSINHITLVKILQIKDVL